MVKEIVVFAPAKINLGLKVLPKREDGFHNLESIFQTLSLKDKITVQELEGYGECFVHCDNMVLPEKNTLNAAYEAFCDSVNIPVHSVDIKLEKNIPSGGGLGGGSSDAAALVRVLEKITQITLSEDALDKIASRVGSDVFFFLHCGADIDGCAVVTGRGEFVKVIEKRQDLHFVLAFPEVSSSTKEAYALVDELYEREKQVIYPDLDKLENIYNLPAKNWTFVNTFTPALQIKFQEIKDILKKVADTGADFCDMTGSGSTVFGVYEQWENASKAKELLLSQGIRVATAK